MRIIAGSHRGRRFRAPKGELTRPTSDRVREALFSMVGPLEGASVLDLFAGSGSLGLEALSRGAGRCLFVESDGAAARMIEDNLAALGLKGASVQRRDAVTLVRAEVARGKSYDLVLADPPYDRWSALEPKLAQPLAEVLAPDGILVIETEARVEPALRLDLIGTRRYGSARLTLFRHP